MDEGTKTSLWRAIKRVPDIQGYRFGTERAVPPKRTLARIVPLLHRAGITRLADLTGLDWLGLPVYQAIRPNSRNITVSMGKGLTRTQAKVSALMESLEGFHAELLTLPAHRATISTLRPALGYDPFQLPLVKSFEHALLDGDVSFDPYAPAIGLPTPLHEHVPLDWIEATNLDTGQRSWLPRSLCELDYRVREQLERPYFRASSNGLASGNTVVEALCHGLLEVLERDAMLRHRDAIHNAERHVRLETITNAHCRRWLARFAGAGMDVTIVDTASPAGIPCFQVFLGHEDQAVRHFGAGCHPDRGTALLRALTEAAQSRLGYIAGSRDDVRTLAYLPAAQARQTAARPIPRRDFASAPSLPRRGFVSVFKDLVRRIRELSGTSPLAVDLRQRKFGYLPVVMVAAPGLYHPAPERQ